MEVFNALRKRIETVNQGLRSGLYIRQIVEENEAFIVDMNAENQLYEQGVNSLGVEISDYRPYTPITIEFKRMKGQPTDRVTLRDTGDFESSFYIEVNDEQFEIRASDPKTETLIRKYGREILGLTNENLSTLIRDCIYPELLEKAKDVIYGNN